MKWISASCKQWSLLVRNWRYNSVNHGSAVFQAPDWEPQNIYSAQKRAIKWILKYATIHWFILSILVSMWASKQLSWLKISRCCYNIEYYKLNGILQDDSIRLTNMQEINSLEIHCSITVLEMVSPFKTNMIISAFPSHFTTLHMYYISPCKSLLSP